MNENKFKKYITPRNIIFMTGIIIFLLLIFFMQDIAIMFFASFVIACSLNPIVDKLTNEQVAGMNAISYLMTNSFNNYRLYK